MAEPKELFEEVRFTSERAASERIAADDELMKHVRWAQRALGTKATRQHLLAGAVRIDARILPELASVFRDITARAMMHKPLEAYVHASTEINAAVVPTGARNMVLLTSGAVERLTTRELDFVIGHELGHAVYGHSDIPIGPVMSDSPGLRPHQAMQLMAWHRMAEISADRAGLLCCGSLEVAASAMFKTLSGLSAKNLQIDPQEFAGQWDELAVEVCREASSEHWLATHPFPPLRMKALLSFCHADTAKRLIPEAVGGTPVSRVDQEIDRLLAMMDPLAREQTGKEGRGDPLLRDFLLWGGYTSRPRTGKSRNRSCGTWPRSSVKRCCGRRRSVRPMTPTRTVSSSSLRRSIAPNY